MPWKPIHSECRTMFMAFDIQMGDFFKGKVYIQGPTRFEIWLQMEFN